MSEKKKVNIEISSDAVQSQPHNTTELINKYGTYEIQPTSDSDHKYPAIAQGLAKNKSIAPKSGNGKKGK